MQSYYNSVTDSFSSVIASKHVLIINVYTLYLCVQLCRQAGKGWRWLFKLLIIFLVRSHYQNYSYGTFIFCVILVYIHRSLPSSHLPVHKKAVIITGKREKACEKEDMSRKKKVF